jgi:hypothetical protein
MKKDISYKGLNVLHDQKTHVMPPPMFPQPPARALAVPSTLAENIWVAQNWQGTNAAPNKPIKNL